MSKNGKYDWAAPNDTEVKTCSICKEEIYGFGNNPQPVINEGKKLEVNDSCCDTCNEDVVMPIRLTQVNNRRDLN